MLNFLLGLISAVLILPLLEGITDLIQTCFEMIKSYCAFKISQNNTRIQNLSTTKNQVIGFAVTEEE